MHNKDMFSKLTLIFLLLSLATSSFGAPPVNLQPINTLQPTSNLQFSIGAGVEYSDNIYLTQTDKVDDYIYHALFSVDYKKKTVNTDLSLDLKTDSYSYQHNYYPNRTKYQGLALFDVTMGPRSTWKTYDRLDNLQISNNLSATPDNYQNVNYFSTGPTFAFFENTKHSLKANVMYQNFYTQDDNSDFYGALAGITYLRNIRRTFTAILDADYNDKRYKDITLNTSYSISNVVLTLKKRMEFSDAEIGLGNSYLETPTTSYNTPLYRFKYNYELGEQNTINLSYRRELQDFAGVYTTTTPGLPQANITSNVFLLKEGIVGIHKLFSFTAIDLTYTYFQNEYSNVTDAANSTTNMTSLSFTNHISNSVSLFINGSYSGIDYPALFRSDIIRFYVIGLTKTFINKYDLLLQCAYTDRSSTDPTYVYDELRTSLIGHYYFK